MTRRVAWVLVVGAILLATPTQALPAGNTMQSAPADSILEHPEDIFPWEVRGTKAPLVGQSSAIHAWSRPLMIVPETVFWLASRPATALINWDERKGASKKVMSWFTRDVQPINTRFSAYLGLEAEVRRDTRDDGEMSANGSLVRIAAGLNVAQRNEDSSYRHVTAEWQGHRPLFRDRTLAARLF